MHDATIDPHDAPTFLDLIGEDRRSELLALGRARTYPAQSIVFFEGDVAHDVIAIVDGDLKVSVTTDGREVMLDVVGCGDVLGEMAAIDGSPRSATAVALTAVEVIAIPNDAFMDFLAEHHDVFLVLTRSIAGRLRDASRRQVEYGALDAVGRVCRRLVELMARYGEPVGNGVLIDAPLTQGDIAAWAGLSREAVVKALHSLRRIGLVTTTPRSITVLDVAAVTARAAIPSP